MQHAGGLSEQLRSAARGLIYLMGFSVPLFFLPWTLDPLELNKQALFVLLTLLATLLWVASMMLEKTITMKRGWSNVLPVVLVLGFGIPAIYSIAPYTSWVGVNTQQYTSVLTIATGAILFYLMSNLFTERRFHQTMHTVLLTSATLLALIGVAGIYDAKLFSVMNLIGTPNSLAVFLSVMSAFSLASWVSHKKGDSILHDGLLGTYEKILAVVLSLLTFFIVLLIDFYITWIIFIFGMVFVLLFVLFRSESFPSLSRLWLPGLLLTLALPFWLWLPTPLKVNLPLEVSLNHQASVDISNQTLLAYSSSYGSGPGTYAFDYNQFHSSNINETDLWATRFDRGSSFVTTLFPTIGYLGITAIGIFVLLLTLRSLAQILRPKSRDEWLESFVHLAPWLTLVVSAFLYPWNFSLMFLFLFFSGLIGSQVLRKSARKNFTKSPAVGLAVSSVFLAGSLLFLVGIFLTTQLYAAEIAFAKAIQIDRDGGDIQEIVASLDRAATLNRFNDAYYRTLSEALLLSLGEQLEQVTSIDTLTAESEQYIQALVSAAVNAAAMATELSPNNVSNWLTRGLVYRELVPVQSSAASFTLESYERAVALERMNPSHWTELGKAYLVAADAMQPLTAAQSKEVAAQAQSTVDAHLEGAESAFNAAIELKSNYAPAHFQLGVVYQRQGRLDDAIGKLESVAQYNTFDVGVHFELGLLYLQRAQGNDVDRAQVVLERAVTLTPSYSNARWFLASVYEIQDEITAAIGQVEAVLALNPGNELVLTRLDRLLRGEVSDQVPEAIEAE